MVERDTANISIKPQEYTIHRESMEVYVYLETIRVFHETAESLCSVKMSDQRITKENFAEEHVRIYTALEDLYHATKNDRLQEFRQQWGEESFLFEQAMQDMDDTLSAIQEQAELQFSNPQTLKKVRLAMQTGKAIATSLTKEQRNYVFRQAGYSNEEIEQIAKKLGISVILAAVSSGIAWSMVGSSAILGREYLTIEELPDREKALIIAASYGVHYLSAAVKSVHHVRMLRRDDIGFGPDIYSTPFYLIIQKMFPDRQKLKEFLTWCVGMSPIIASESWSSLALLPNGLSMLVARNLAGSTFNSLATILIKAYIRWKDTQTSTPDE